MENTDKPKNTKPQIFRDTANDEEWKKLVELALSTNPIGTKVPDEYGFSWSAIRSDAVERGYYEPKRRLAPTSIPDTPVTPTFQIEDITDEPECISRSIQLYADISNRLNALCSSKQQYTKKAILNQLLNEALEKYGY